MSSSSDENVYVMGIDEAGRGPVLGPMVYACAYCKLADKHKIKQKFKVDDSKELTSEIRNSIFERMSKAKDIWYLVDVISPHEMSQKMLSRRKYNLNLISHDSAAGLIKQGISHIEDQLGGVLKEVYLDTVGPPQKYQKKLEKLFPDLKIVVEKKADSVYPIVSAASIVAKVTRDKLLHSFESDQKMGTGYPSDDKTIKWLQDHKDPVFGWKHDLVRFGWSTVRKIMNDPVEVEWSDNEEEEEDMQQTRISQFTNSKDRKYIRYSYFEDCSMEIVHEF